MWTSIPVIFACLSSDDCRPFIGAEMAHSQCIATSQAMLADFQRQYPYEIKGISCVEPRRLQAILGRTQV